MIHDAQNLFSDAQALTATAASTNLIDLGSARNIGVGQNLYVVTIVDTAFTDSGSDSTCTVSLEGDSTTSFTPDGTQQLYVIPALAAAGARYVGRINPDFAGNYRYIQVKYTMANGNLTTGAVTTFLTLNPDGYTSYPKGYTIS